MPEKLLQHKHCLSCGKAVKPSEDYCSDDCRERHHATIKKKRRQLVYLWVGAMGVLILVFFVSGAFG